MFKALIRRIVEAVRGAIANEQERVDLSIRIPVGHLVACRRVHGQRKRHTPKRRRQHRDEAGNDELEKRLAKMKSEKGKIRAQARAARKAAEADIQKLQVKNSNLAETLANVSKERDQARTAHKAAEADIQKLQVKNSNLTENLTNVSKERDQAHAAHKAAETDTRKLQVKNSNLAENLANVSKERDQARTARKAAENNIRKLQNSSLAKNLADVSKELERRKRFPHLEFGPDAVHDYENLHPDVLPKVSRRLEKLVESFMEWRVNGGREPFLTRQAHWWRCDARDEGDTVKSNPRFRKQRRFESCHGGQRYFFWHINCGELDGKKGRIHFRFDESTHEVEIGYIGGHLELPTA